jgi:short-subunit dehydrogenase
MPFSRTRGCGFVLPCSPRFGYDTPMKEFKLPFSGTALVTGASSGLGAAFARRLASLGHDLVLVARREDRLKALAAELTSKHGVRVDVVAADLAAEAGRVRVEEFIRSRPDIALLVNNAGFGAGGFYHLIDMAKQTDMIRVHVEATARLTRAALPLMVERNAGGVVNVASGAAFSIVAKSAMYGSTKAWMVSFSRALAEELRKTEVRMQALCPGFTVTEFHDGPEFAKFDRKAIPGLLWMPAEKVVDYSLRKLRGHRTIVIPGFWNRMVRRIVSLPGAGILMRIYSRRQR